MHTHVTRRARLRVELRVMLGTELHVAICSDSIPALRAQLRQLSIELAAVHVTELLSLIPALLEAIHVI